MLLGRVEIDKWVGEDTSITVEYHNFFVTIQDRCCASGVALFVIQGYFLVLCSRMRSRRASLSGLMGAFFWGCFSLCSFHSRIHSRASALNAAGNNATSMVGEWASFLSPFPRRSGSSAPITTRATLTEISRSPQDTFGSLQLRQGSNVV